MTTEHRDLQAPWLPTDYVLAAIDNPENARKASEALRHSGFHAEDIQNLPGQEASDQLDTNCEHCGAIKHIARVLWRYFSIQGNTLSELEKQGKAGSHILTVHVRDREEAKLAADVLLGHQAHHVLHFGPNYEVIEFPPESGGDQNG